MTKPNDLNKQLAAVPKKERSVLLAQIDGVVAKVVAKYAKPEGLMTAAQLKKLPQWKRSVLIATDVIESIRLRKFQVETGGYLNDHSGLYKLGLMGDAANEANTKLALGTDTLAGQQCVLDAKCTVCAKGAMFLASIFRSNRANVDDVLSASADTMRCRLVDDDRMFSPKTYDMIEVAFERRRQGECELFWHDHFRSESAADDAATKCRAFGNRFIYNQTARLVAIMLNIIRHKGKFVPSSRYPSLKQVEQVMAKRKPKKKGRSNR